MNSRSEIIRLFKRVSRTETIAGAWMFDNSTFREYSESMLDSVDAVLEALGGPAKVAQLCGVGASAVSNWKSRGRIAAEKFLVLSDALRGVGASVDPLVFGMTATRPAEARP